MVFHTPPRSQDGVINVDEDNNGSDNEEERTNESQDMFPPKNAQSSHTQDEDEDEISFNATNTKTKENKKMQNADVRQQH